MEVTHELVIKQLDQLNDDSGIVKYICYELISSAENRSVKWSGFIELDTDTIENFISYEDLTEEVILDWTYAHNSDKIEQQKLMNEERLNAILNVTAASSKNERLPWEPELVVEEPEEQVIEESQSSLESQEEQVIEESQSSLESQEDEEVIEEPVLEETEEQT